MRWALRISLVGSSILSWCTVVPASEAEVRKAISAYVDAFNENDLEAVENFLAEDVTYTDHSTGEESVGRDAIVDSIRATKKASPDAKMLVNVERVRLIKPDVAIVNGLSVVDIPGEAPVQSQFQSVVMKTDAGWVLQSVTESEVPVPKSASEALAPLSWLVGSWEDVGDDHTVRTETNWAPGGAYIIRSFSVIQQDDAQRQGTQIIGWDAKTQQIRSWTFNLDGSFGSGTWSKNGEDWLIQSTQTLSDGRAAAGTYILSAKDSDTVQIRLIGHSIDGTPQPTRPAVTVTRVSETASKTNAAAEETSDSASDQEN